MLESRDELDANDILRPHVLARIVTSSWLRAPLGFDAWRLLQSVLHEELSLLRRRGVPRDQPLPARSATCCPRSTCGRSSAARTTAAALRAGRLGAAASARRPACRRAAASEFQPSATRAQRARSEVGEETRMMTRAAGLARSTDQAEAVLGRLNRLVGRQLPDFARHLARAGAAVAAPERRDRRGAGGRRAPPRQRGRRDGSSGAPSSARRRCSRNCTSASRR